MALTLTAADVKRLYLALLQRSAFTIQNASASGTGLPTGGSTGQVLTKTSNSDFVTGWTTPTSIADVITYLYANYAMVYAGAGAPEGAVNAFYGSMYNRDNGFVYRKSSAGYGNTGWDQLL